MTDLSSRSYPAPRPRRRVLALLAATAAIAAAPFAAALADPPSKGSVAGVANVTAAEVQAMADRGERVRIIDARKPGAWDKGRLLKAVKLNWRYSNVTRGWAFDKNDLGGDKTVRLVIYGQSESDGFAALAAEKALEEGFANVMWMRGGFNEWIAARLPTEAGS